jgi:hypothetical protein
MQEKTEEQITEEWATMMLDEATDAMSEASIPITPESLHHYFEQHYELPLSAVVAHAWLETQPWYHPKKGEMQ